MPLQRRRQSGSTRSRSRAPSARAERRSLDRAERRSLMACWTFPRKKKLGGVFAQRGKKWRVESKVFFLWRNGELSPIVVYVKRRCLQGIAQSGSDTPLAPFCEGRAGPASRTSWTGYNVPIERTWFPSTGPLSKFGAPSACRALAVRPFTSGVQDVQETEALVC